MIALRALDPGGERPAERLIELLEYAVASGASVGFRLLLERVESERYRPSVVAGRRAGRLRLIAAFERERSL